MKSSLLLILCVLALASCRTPGVVQLADGMRIQSPGAVGGRGTVTVRTAAWDEIVMSDDQEASFRESAAVAKVGLISAALVDGAGIVKDGFTSVKNAKTAADVTKHGATAAVEQQRIAADLAGKVAEINAQGGFAQ